MKILFIYNESNIEGKGNIDAFLTSRELRRLGHECLLVLRKDDPRIFDNVAAILPKPIPAMLMLPIIASKILKIISKYKPDVIIAEGNWYIPLLVSIVNYNNIPVVYNMRTIVLESLVAFHAKSAFIRTVSKILMRINYSILKRSKYLIAINPSLCKFYGDRLGREVKMIGTHPMNFGTVKPISTDEIKEIKGKYRIDQDTLAIIYSGAIESWIFSYVVDLADCVFQLRKEGYPVQLVIMGYGSMKGDYVRYINSKKEELDNQDVAVVLPWLDHSEVPKVIESCDICVDPLLRPFPLNYSPAGKLMEYMVCGKCIITTIGPSNEEIIRNEYNGMVVDGTKDQLYYALKRVVSDKNSRDMLGRNARETMLKEHAARNDIGSLEQYLISCSIRNSG